MHQCNKLKNIFTGNKIPFFQRAVTRKMCSHIDVFFFFYLPFSKKKKITVR